MPVFSVETSRTERCGDTRDMFVCDIHRVFPDKVDGYPALCEAHAHWQLIKAEYALQIATASG